MLYFFLRQSFSEISKLSPTKSHLTATAGAGTCIPGFLFWHLNRCNRFLVRRLNSAPFCLLSQWTALDQESPVIRTQMAQGVLTAGWWGWGTVGTEDPGSVCVLWVHRRGMWLLEWPPDPMSLPSQPELILGRCELRLCVVGIQYFHSGW